MAILHSFENDAATSVTSSGDGFLILIAILIILFIVGISWIIISVILTLEEKRKYYRKLRRNQNETKGKEKRE